METQWQFIGKWQNWILIKLAMSIMIKQYNTDDHTTLKYLYFHGQILHHILFVCTLIWCVLSCSDPPSLAPSINSWQFVAQVFLLFKGFLWLFLGSRFFTVCSRFSSKLRWLRWIFLIEPEPWKSIWKPWTVKKPRKNHWTSKNMIKPWTMKIPWKNKILPGHKLSANMVKGSCKFIASPPLSHKYV